MNILLTAFCLFALANSGYTAPSQEQGSIPPPPTFDYRLPTTVWPSYYRIQLTPYLLASDPNRFTFDGDVEITVRASSMNVRNITLHARDLTFTNVTIRRKDSTSLLQIDSVSDWDRETHKFNVNLDFTMDPSTDYVLKFIYSGKMGDDMHGFYRSKYINANKQEIWIASTQFQTNHARRAFPSFDEPKFKAKFKIDITYPDNFDVISNTLPESTIKIPGTGRSITVFKETPIMSTYLIAFIVSDFQARGSGNYKVIARPEAYNQTAYAYEVGPKILSSLDRFTDYPYNTQGLEKMYVVGIPDFSAGAMENWGLNTYRETALLYDPSASTLLNQQRIAAVISHEFGHQWFGDLVTCDWWGYTWLNEGFGRYFQYFTTHDVEPTWELDKQFVVEQIQSVMNMDALPGTTPMNDPAVGSAAELSRMFNSISYNKGATILRMIEHLITPTKFRDALRSFLKARAFQTSVPQHLIDAFNSQYTEDLSPMIRDWTDQVGYPVVTINLASNGLSFTMKQNRFLLREDAGNASLLYRIPFTYTTDASANFTDTSLKFVFPKVADEVNFTLAQPAKWIIGNIQEVGYYRVHYDTNTWKNIRSALGSNDFGKIHVVNRAQIVDDVFNFGRAGLISYNQVIDIVGYLKSETEYLPWYSAFQGYSYLTSRLGLQNQKYFKTYILGLLDAAYKSVGFKYDPRERRLVTYNRASILAWACRYEHEDCVKSSRAIFKNLTDSNTPVEVNIRSVVYCAAVRNGGASDFKFLWDKFKNENVATEQVLILNSLGCSKNKTIIHDYLDLILSDEVRLQDRQAAVTATYTNNVENVDYVWEYVENKYNQMIASFGSQSTVANIINGLASRFTTDAQKSALEKFIREKGSAFGSSVSTLNTALSSVVYNIKWAEKSMKPFVDHLKSVGDSATSVTISTILLVATTYIVAFLN